MKRFFALLLCTAMFLVLLPAYGVATTDDEVYLPFDKGTVIFDKSTGTIVGHDGVIENAVIPETLDGVTVKAIGFRAFSRCETLKAVSIPNTVTEIGNDAFYDCEALTEVTIPDSVTSLGNYAFEDCTSLKKVTIGNGVTKIGDSAFSFCEKLEDLTIGTNVEQIGESAFFGCSALTEVTLPDRVKVIGRCAFIYCNELTTIRFGNGLERIGEDAFYGCYNLSELTFPESLKQIDAYAFGNCSALAEITIPKNIEHIGESAFISCTGLKKIVVDEENQNYSSDNFGVLFNKDKTRLIKCPQAYCGDYTIPDSVKKIETEAFYVCPELTAVTMGKNVEVIGLQAFYSCEKLTALVLGDSVRQIGDEAFAFCTELAEVRIGKGVEAIGELAFDYNGKLSGIWVDEGNPNFSSDEHGALFDKAKTRLIKAPQTLADEYIIPQTVTQIDAAALRDCAELRSLVLPEGLKSIGDNAFAYCERLSDIAFPDSIIRIGSATMEGTAYCNNQNNWSDGLLYNGKHLIAAMDFLTEVTLRNDTLTLSASIFESSSFTSITLPQSLRSIGDYAFCYSYIDSISIGKNVAYIGSHAFDSCDALGKITVDEDNSYYTSDAHDVLFNKDKTELFRFPEANNGYNGEYQIPGSVTKIAEGAFSGCSGLVDITIPEGVKTIGTSAFSNCDGIENLTIPGSVETIEDWAFCGCEELKQITLSEGVKHIGTEAFDSSSLWIVTLPKSLTSIGKGAFANCDCLGAVNYAGSATDWEKITVGDNNDPLLSANIRYGYVTGEEATTQTPFKDVKQADFFAKPVSWAVANGITTGMSEASFAPNAPCTRAQIVTFLWRAFGSPEPGIKDNPFKDVKESDYYYKAVLWAVSCSITEGTGENTFSPNAVCTRGQVVTLLRRSQTRTNFVETNHPFNDVAYDDYFYEGVIWAVENGITQGVGGGKFDPNTSCTRGQIVTFLYRTMG